MGRLTLLGFPLDKTGQDDYSFHGYDRETGVRFLVGSIDWPRGTETPWYAAVETIPGVQSKEAGTISWRFEGPFRRTPEEACRDFEAAWDASRKADRRCNPPAQE